ncbi:unnamed protein product [Calicophoron daubneyi]|uniref:Uncharacterized protein n=1 Tax=Calicophoron daubneyi TaxID=300641 RepID=A0AAV2TSX3_CALDB
MHFGLALSILLFLYTANTHASKSGLCNRNMQIAICYCNSRNKKEYTECQKSTAAVRKTTSRCSKDSYCSRYSKRCLYAQLGNPVFKSCGQAQTMRRTLKRQIGE